ncbi:MAG: secondary thiamine-phosphate synthase enzyme YjbQ [Bacteroidota bacterium]|nr:secondary thiamine-phosphate synthase enzyme YjbQ [Bacteroidota bacterium]
MISQFEFSLPAFPRGFHLITDKVLSHLGKLPEAGVLHLFIKHTSAALTINENADPSVRDDFETIMNKLVPENDPDYTHTMEGADDMPAHVKTSLMDYSISIPITKGSLNTGAWQGIYLCEFRNHGGSRKIVASIYS